MVFLSARFFLLSIDEMLRQDTPNHLGAWDIHHPDLFLCVPNIKHSRKELTTLEFTQKIWVGGGNKNYGFPKKKCKKGVFQRCVFGFWSGMYFIPTSNGRQNPDGYFFDCLPFCSIDDHSGSDHKLKPMGV